MPKTGNYYWTITDGTDVAAVDQTFNAARKSSISLNSVLRPSRTGDYFTGKIEAIVIKVKTIAGGAGKITIKGIGDGAAILPDTEADIALDVGSTTEGTVTYYAGLAITLSTDTLDIFYTCDVGTIVIDSATVSWSE